MRVPPLALVKPVPAATVSADKENAPWLVRVYAPDTVAVPVRLNTGLLAKVKSDARTRLVPP